MEGLAQAAADGAVDITDGLVAIEGEVVAGKLLYELALESDASEILLDGLSLTDAVAIVFQGKATAQYILKLNGQVGASDYNYIATYGYGSSGVGGWGDSTSGDIPLSTNSSGEETTLCLALIDIVDSRGKCLSYANGLGDSDSKEMFLLQNGKTNFSMSSITRISLIDTNGGDGFKTGSVVRIYQLG